MKIEDRPSPNYGPRRGQVRADMVVLHYTGMQTAKAALSRLSDPASEVSAHYVVTERGRVLRLVPEEARAWHAGQAHWAGTDDVNSRSIGIELVNPGHENGYRGFPEPQMAALEALLGGILERHEIRPERVVGHGCVAPGRKIDPGERFDWRRLARSEMSVWLDAPPAGPDTAAGEAWAFQAAARTFGYGVPQSGTWDRPTLDIWDAFLRRFRPAETGCAPHAPGVAHLDALARRWPASLDAPASTA